MQPYDFWASINCIAIMTNRQANNNQDPKMYIVQTECREQIISSTTIQH